MITSFIKYIYEYFGLLIEQYGFNKQKEINEGETYSVEYCSKNFIIKIEKYRREFYLTLYKSDNSKQEIDLFNLLAYLYQDSSNIPEAEYFRNQKDIEESYRKQLDYLSKMVFDNFVVINDFFSSKNYETKLADIEKFMLNKYPELFKRT